MSKSVDSRRDHTQARMYKHHHYRGRCASRVPPGDHSFSSVGCGRLIVYTHIPASFLLYTDIHAGRDGLDG